MYGPPGLAEATGNRCAVPWLIASTRLADGEWLQVGKTTEAQAALLEHFRVVFGTVLVLALVFGLAAGLLLTGRALRPIRRLIEAFERVLETGDMDARIQPLRERRRTGPADPTFQPLAGKECRPDPRHARGAG